MRAFLFLIALTVAVRPTFAENCQDLTALPLPYTTITLAEAVLAGGFNPPGPPMPMGPPGAFKGLPAFCRVAATSKPTNDSDIEFEVWMPLENWKGKFEGTGNGVWLGAIIYTAPAEGLRRAYAVVNADTGHEGGPADASWALGHPEKVIDFGYCAVHEMTVQGKAIVTAFYGKRPAHAYWVGCSSACLRMPDTAMNASDSASILLCTRFWYYLQRSAVPCSERIHWIYYGLPVLLPRRRQTPSHKGGMPTYRHVAGS